MYHPNNLSLLPDDTEPRASRSKSKRPLAEKHTGIPLDTVNCLPHKEFQSFEMFNWQTDFLMAIICIENYTDFAAIRLNYELDSILIRTSFDSCIKTSLRVY